MALTPGTQLGPYEIQSLLGAGGMGEVYRARDTRLNRDVALKVLPSGVAHDVERMARFRREAQILAALNDPHIAAIYGLEDSNETPALVMELVEGPTLAEKIARKGMAPEEALPLARQIAGALEYAHERGVTHRDLKPANIKLTADGIVKVLDFGLAKVLLDETSPSDPSSSPTFTNLATQAGMMVGTAAYMSPEQAKGKAVDRRGDIWAFGCVLYEMLAGTQAFSGETATDILATVIKSEPDWSQLPVNTPPTIRGLLQRCLRKDLRQRLQSIGDARILVEEIENGTAEANSTGAVSLGQPRDATWRRALPWATAAILAVIAAIASLTYYRAVSKPEPVLRFSLQTPATGQFYSQGSALALSPDGTRLAYTHGSAYSGRLYLQALDQAEAVPLAGTEGASTPFFSPDGRWIGFFAEGKLKKISVFGGAPVTLCDASNSRGAAWGPDDTILFTPTSDGPLERISAAGGAPQPVTTLHSAPESESRSHRYPEFLPGGKEALFNLVYRTGNPLDNADIAVLSLKTGEYKIVLHGGSYPRYVSPGYIIYAHGGDLVAVPFDESHLAVTGPPTTVVKGVSMFYGSGAAYYTISRTGTLIYVPESAQLRAKGKLAWVNRQGKAEPISQTIRNYSNPRLLPGDQRLVVEVDDDPPSIWQYDFARDTLSPLAIDGGNFFPVVSPDGKQVAMVSIRNGSEGIFLHSLEGSGAEQRLTATTHLQRPDSFSPDGKLLVFTEGSPTQSLLRLLPLVGSADPKPLLPGPGNRATAAISRDGLWVAYVSDESGRNEIYVESFPGGGNRTQISSEGGTAPVWSHDGRELFYRHGDQLMALQVKTKPTFSTGKPQELFEGTLGNGVGAREYRSAGYELVPDYDVSQDGKRFLMIQAVGPTPLSAVPRLEGVLNWFEELRHIAGKAAP